MKDFKDQMDEITFCTVLHNKLAAAPTQLLNRSQNRLIANNKIKEMIDVFDLWQVQLIVFKYPPIYFLRLLAQLQNQRWPFCHYSLCLALHLKHTGE